MPLQGDAPPGRANRLGLAPVPSGTSQVVSLPSRIAHGGHRRNIAGELAGQWRGRPAAIFDVVLVSDYGARGEALPGAVKGRFHAAALGVRGSFSWWAVTRPDLREHLDSAGRGIPLSGGTRLAGIRQFADQATPPVPAAVMEWVRGDAMSGNSGRQLSGLELAGGWTFAFAEVPRLEHSDENAAALAAKLGRPEVGPWPERMLSLLEQFATQLEHAARD